MKSIQTTYGDAIRDGFVHLLDNHPEVFVLGQGVWSPWYVGNSMRDLDKVYGKDRIIDTPVSEAAMTSTAVGASLCGMKPIVIHPRMDFMILATDSIVNQAAKWSHMLGGQAHPSLTIRAIINRGGEQGAQHSQALHSWYAHIPGLRVVMPSTVQDARDLLIAATLCEDPVLYIDDKWLYDRRGALEPSQDVNLRSMTNQVVRQGTDLTIAGASYSAYLAEKAADQLAETGISCEVIDIRILNPLDPEALVKSVSKTGRLLVVDGGWRTCGLSAELIACVVEAVDPALLKASPQRITLPDAPAPSSSALERIYYPTVDTVIETALQMLG